MINVQTSPCPAVLEMTNSLQESCLNYSHQSLWNMVITPTLWVPKSLEVISMGRVLCLLPCCGVEIKLGTCTEALKLQASIHSVNLRLAGSGAGMMSRSLGLQRQRHKLLLHLTLWQTSLLFSFLSFLIPADIISLPFGQMFFLLCSATAVHIRKSCFEFSLFHSFFLMPVCCIWSQKFESRTWAHYKCFCALESGAGAAQDEKNKSWLFYDYIQLLLGCIMAFKTTFLCCV